MARPTIRQQIMGYGQNIHRDRQKHNSTRHKCRHSGCEREFKTEAALTYHQQSVHVQAAKVDDSPEPRRRVYHGHLTADPCPAPSSAESLHNPYGDFGSRFQFEFGEFLYKRMQVSGTIINELMDFWALDVKQNGRKPPFANAEDLHYCIDNLPYGDVRWECFNMSYTGSETGAARPTWMDAQYEIWFRDPKVVDRQMIETMPFERVPYKMYRIKDGQRVYEDFMSGMWSWNEADALSDRTDTKGAMQVGIGYGSDKTTVTVATGQNEYYPLYETLTNLTNADRRAHGGAVVLIGFLAIPKGERNQDSSLRFRKFRRQLFHSAMTIINQRFGTAFETPELTKCSDGLWRRAIYSLAVYLADYPEQVLLASIVQGWCPWCLARHDDLDGMGGYRSREHREAVLNQMNLTQLWDIHGIIGDVRPFTDHFPRADIHQMLSFDLLHQVIKGTFKDHLVEWLGDYLKDQHGEAEAKRIIDDIDRRYVSALNDMFNCPLYLCCPAFVWRRSLEAFDDSRMGEDSSNDSKALMKIYLSCIEGHVPAAMLRAFRAFLDFCYLARRAFLTEAHLDEMDAKLDEFHMYRRVFMDREDDEGRWSTAPRQHSMVHYRHMVELFGAPTGLCTSICESKHIVAVKKPDRRVSCHQALGQMILVNQRLEKLALCRQALEKRGHIQGSLFEEPVLEDHGLPPVTILEEDQAAIDLATDKSDSLMSNLDITFDIDDLCPAEALDARGTLIESSSSLNDTILRAHPSVDKARESELDGSMSNPSQNLDGSDSHNSDSEEEDPDVDLVDDPRSDSHVFMARSVVRNLPRQVGPLGYALCIPGFADLCEEFLESQLPRTRTAANSIQSEASSRQKFAASTARIQIHEAAIALFHAPSDPSGIHGMKREWIRCTAKWKGRKREHCVLVDVDPTEAPGGIQAACVKLLFTLKYHKVEHECALVHWYTDLGHDSDTGMRVISPSLWPNNSPELAVIPLKSILRAAHLVPIYGPTFVPNNLRHWETLDAFLAFYLNCYIDHNMFDLLRK